MSKRNLSEKIKLQSYNDMFGEDENTEIVVQEQIKDVALSELYTFKNHPFKVSDDAKMEEMVESVKQYGILVPAIARERVEGGYELISGHRRHHAATAIDPKLHETLPHHLTFLMDEFANVTLPDSFVEKLSTMRSRNMSAVIIVQNLIQLKRKFPKFDMDKDLIGNCSIIDILGAPDMDSCEYLSKHFGTQTIHKASDSDAKDYKGSSSRSEDVMQKPLLSAEDIFAMKKDGECAIVIKGADPLFETKCRMEKTPFVKLLCRKHNPYDPKKTRQKREMFKAENSSFFLCGEVAEAQAKKIREAGSPIIRLTEADVNNLILAGKMDAPVTTLKLTEAMQKTLHENYEKYVDEHSNIPVDFSIYKDKDDDSMEARNRYVRRAETVQNLIQAGYTKAQIRFLYELIMADYGADRIQKMFPTDCTIDEIKNFAKIL